MSDGSTLLDKIWRSHAVLPSGSDQEALIYVDRNLVHEESTWAFDALRQVGGSVARPDRNIAFSDHYVPTVQRQHGLSAVADGDVRHMLTQITANAAEHRLRHFGLDHPLQGIMHVVAPELGLVQPGFVVTGSDSHTCTNGALGALAFGIGQTELKQVFMTQTVWRKKPRVMRIAINGRLGPGVTAKDVALAIIGEVGANGGAGHVVEYAGSCVEQMTIEQRMTICNMSIEMGAQSGLIAPDDMTFDYLSRRPYAPKGAAFAEAVSYWRTLRSDDAAEYDRDLLIDAGAIEPMVTWGTSLEDVVGVSGTVPAPKNSRMQRALAYMGLSPGTAMRDIAIDQVFIGSCANARIEDLRVAAAIVKGRRVAVPSMVSPGSSSVKRQAEGEGLDDIFEAAGFEFRDSGCSMCVGSNGDVVASGKRCASTSPRNFEGRQGVGARTHVMSPAMAAAAAVTGRICDVRTLMA